jgi:hypothetical protein
MGKITLNPDLRSKLNGLTETLEVCDESGTPIGMFLPLGEYKKLLRREVAVPFTEEQIRRLRNQQGGRPLAEIMKELQQS